MATIIAGLALLLLVVLPSLTLVYQSAGMEVPPQLTRLLPMLEPVYTWLLIAFCAIWIVFFGGCIASFLNVVAWRLPRGMSILGRSHCPQCNTRLSLRENLPIWGWLSCGGRCRYCDQAIPVRYLIVELGLGLALLFLGILEMTFGGWSLPRSMLNLESVHRIALFDESLLWIFSSHVVLVSTLYSHMLIRLETERLPYSVSLVSVFIALGLFVSSASVRSVFLLGLPAGVLPLGEFWAAAISASAAIAFSFACGQFLSFAAFFSANQIREMTLGLAVIAAFLGFWPVFIITGLQIAAIVLFEKVWKTRVTLSAIAFGTTLIFFTVWRYLF